MMSKQWLLVLASFASALGVRAQPVAETGGVGPAVVEASIREQWRRAAEFPAITDLAINWRLETYFVPGAKDLDALREEVRKNPASKRAVELAEYERRITEKTPLVRTFSFRARGPGEWRLCQNAGVQNSQAEFVDYVMTDQAAWKLTPNWLVLIDPSKPMPEGHPLRDVGAFFMNDLGMLLDGGVRSAALVGAELNSISRSGDSWRSNHGGNSIADPAASVQTDGAREIEWLWDSDAQRAFVSSVRLTAGSAAGERCDVGGWSLHEAGPIWIAGRVEKYDADNRLVSVLILERVAREAPERFAEVVAAPFFDASDALRGSLKLRSITDFRGEPPMEMIQTSEGVQSFPVGMAAEVVDKGEDDYRRLGWGLAGLTAVSLMFVRLCRRRGAGTSFSHSKESPV